MRKALLIFVVCFLLTTSLVSAAEESVGIEPDSMFYGLKLGMEKVRMVFTFNSVKKAELHMNYATRRLAEAKAMLNKGKKDYVEKSIIKYNAELSDMEAELDAAKAKEEKVDDLVKKIDTTIPKHTATLERLLKNENMPDSAKKGLENALENSKKGREKALEAVGKQVQKKAEQETKQEEVKTTIEEKKEEKTAEQTEKKKEKITTTEEKKEEKVTETEAKKTETKKEEVPAIDPEKFFYKVIKCTDKKHIDVSGKVNGKPLSFQLGTDQFFSDAAMKLKVVSKTKSLYAGFGKANIEDASVNFKIVNENSANKCEPLKMAKPSSN